MRLIIHHIFGGTLATGGALQQASKKGAVGKRG